MKTISNQDKIYIGRNAGLEILEALRNSKKSIKIVSPYLSGSYLEKLVSLQKKKIDITLITSDDIKEEATRFSNFRLSDIIKQKKIPLENAKNIKKPLNFIFLIMLISSALLFLLTPLFPVLLFISIPLLIISILGILFPSFPIKNYDYEYYPIFRIKIFDSKSGDKPWSTNLIHSKIFLIDEEIAFLGSANFTYSGFKTHYETVIKILDLNAIKDISDEIENLYNSTELKSKSIEELGKRIYE